MYKYITILGAAGQIAQKLTATLLTYTDMHLTLYGRQLSTRLHPEILQHEGVTIIEGSIQTRRSCNKCRDRICRRYGIWQRYGGYCESIEP